MNEDDVARGIRKYVKQETERRQDAKIASGLGCSGLLVIFAIGTVISTVLLAIFADIGGFWETLGVGAIGGFLFIGIVTYVMRWLGMGD